MITKCRVDGSYDIEYEDGKKEDHVEKKFIRPSLNSKKSSKSVDDDKKNDKKKTFKEGQKVEAQFQEKSKWMPGKVARVRLNGTYDIQYDNDEKEQQVKPEFIREIDSIANNDQGKRKSSITTSSKGSKECFDLFLFLSSFVSISNIE